MDNEYIEISLKFPMMCAEFFRHPIFLHHDVLNMLTLAADENPDGHCLETWVRTLLWQLNNSPAEVMFVCGGYETKIIATHLPDAVLIRAAIQPRSGFDPSPIVAIRKTCREELPPKIERCRLHFGTCPQCRHLSLHATRATGVTSVGCHICGYQRLGHDVAEGLGVVSIFVHDVGGSVELRRPMPEDYERFDELLASGQLITHESYISEVLDADTERQVVIATRGELP